VYIRVYINVRTRILSVFSPHAVSQSYSYRDVRQVVVTDENNLVAIEQSKDKCVSLGIAASTFTDIMS
jgi:hypothetical protein